MAYDFAADLTTMFSTDEHAQLATYTRQGYAAVQILVIFGNEFIVADGAEGHGVGSSAPGALCKTADVPNASAGDRLQVGSINYYVLQVQDDGTGVTTLILSEDPT